MATGQARKRRPRKRSTDTTHHRAKRGRAEYVIQCIHDQPWLDGKRRRLVQLVVDRFGGSEYQATEAVKLAEQWLDEEREANIPRLVGFLDRVHRHTIEMGQRQGDGRVITPAAAELRKLHGIGEPDRVQLSGQVQGGGLSADAAALLGALKLTNAQRLAEIDKLEKEIADAEQSGAADLPAVVSGADVTEGINHGTQQQEPGSDEDDFDDE